MSSCVEQGSGNKRKPDSSSTTSSGATSETPDTPDFGSNNNFFQEGSIQSESGLTIPISFNDSFYLRGPKVDYYIKNGNKTTNKCLAFRYDDGIDTYLILAAIPQYFYNFATNTQEYYYLIAPGDKVKNQTFCQTPGVQATLSSINGLYAKKYSLIETCTSCPSGLFQSKNTDLFSEAGNLISDIGVASLSLKFSNTISNPADPNIICNSSAECKTQAFDCCIEGQCVNDKSIKGGVDQSSSPFQDAITAIGLDPSLYNSYPQFFNLCPITIAPEPDVPVITNPTLTALERLIKLRELYECTTPQEGEVSFCTKTIEEASLKGPTFYTENDDRNFNTYYSGTKIIPGHSIRKITYNDLTYFEEGLFLNNDVTIGPSGDLSGNDNPGDPQQVNLNVASALPIDTLKIKYMVDGSCRIVGPGLAKCDKYYEQGKNTGTTLDHFPASQNFNLPYYADANRTVSVNVDDSIVLNGSDWTLTQSSPSFITFNNTFQIFDTQEVKITFYVDIVANPIFESKLAALEEIATMCECPDLSCSLKPILSDDKTLITDFVCQYPQPDVPEPPLQQNILLSSKTVPVRYFDTDGGVEHTDVNTDTPQQEGLPFSYTNGNLSKPNNVDAPVGFNEIYGSITGEATAASAAKRIKVKKGKSYDIFVNSGTFSSCFYCGTDYFSNLAKVFPSNFIFKGGGYFPHPSATNESVTEMPAHDQLFGRACFVPATMIPFTHAPDADRQTQRMNRQAAQHFLFANGYQRDWFGFDYGSVIGSFDGVRWFSVGNQRRITATTTSLYLAVNAYYGDQTIESTFSVDVNEASTTPASGALVTTDYESDGAQCQKYHACDTDNDCAATLGWDYTCTSITSLQSAWPIFDQNAKEIPGQSLFARLITLNGTTSGPSKRCVYRGKGATCKTDLQSNFSNTDSFNQSTDRKLLTCSPNTYCQTIYDGDKKSKFNNKIARYGRSVKTLIANNTLDASFEDTFGLSAKQLGRPYNHYGTDEISNEALGAFNSAVTSQSVAAICIPGKSPENTDYVEINNKTPDPGYSDKVNNLGVTPSGSDSAGYYSSCPVIDETGNFVHNTELTINGTPLVRTDDSDIVNLAASQNLSTNHLLSVDNEINILSNFELEYVSTKQLEINRCLRAPGASCFSNFECASSDYIVNKVKSLTNMGVFNTFERDFWTSELVCSQSKPKNAPDYDPRDNRCCRELGNVITIKNEEYYSPGNSPSTNPDNSRIPGVEISINDPRRNSSVTPAIFATRDNPNVYPKIVVSRKDQKDYDFNKILKQYNTINKVAAKTCCSENWVRNFHDGTNNWDPNKMQNVTKTDFQCFNWVDSFGSNVSRGFKCDAEEGGPDHPDCSMRSIPTAEANKYMNFFSLFELTGIPQVLIPDPLVEAKCTVQYQATTSSVPTAPATPLAVNGYMSASNALVEEYEEGGIKYYQANHLAEATGGGSINGGIHSSKKKVFSEDEFTCCQPVGTEMLPTDDPTMCCSGYINPDNNQCALKNYTNLSVYFNRYVSSEAKDLAPALIDEKSGYIKSNVSVQQLACTKQACASGFVGYGILHTDLKVPGHEANDISVRRFIDGNSQANNFNGKVDIFDEGLHWNTHVYCIPEELASASADVLKIFDCGQN
jgi:hypothetical protein